MSIRDRKTLYHLTKLDNLDNILKYGLISRKLLIDNGLYFEDVADSEIINFRSKMNLEQYVPFHFYPHTPFDWVVQNNNPDADFIYICISKETAEYNNFNIIPMHPLSMNPFHIYDYNEGIEAINWDLMNKRDYNDPVCKSVCMAECITNLIVPYKVFQSIAVKNSNIKKIVEDKIRKYKEKNNITETIYIDERPSWFNEKIEITWFDF